MHTQRSLFKVPLDTNKRFVERHTLMAVLEKSFGFHRLSIPRGRERIVLAGMGGCGKTELALRFAEQHRHDFVAVFWLDASGIAQITSSLLVVAKTVVPNKDVDLGSALWNTKDWLSNNEHWLVVIDNLDDDEMIEFVRTQFLDASMEGSVLVTSRQNTFDLFWDVIEVGDFEPDEARTLLSAMIASRTDKICPLSLEDSLSIDALTTSLGFHALAIDQAGCYIREQRITIDEYRSFFEAEKTRLLSRSASRAQQDQNRQSSWTAFAVSYCKLQNLHRGASCLLLLFAFLDYNNISMDFLASGCGSERAWTWDGEYRAVIESDSPEDYRAKAGLAEVFLDAISLRETVTILFRYSFVRWKDSSNALAVHPLLHAWAKEQVLEAGLAMELEHCAIWLISNGFEPQDLLPPMAPPSVKWMVGEERRLRLWPWRHYPNLASHVVASLTNLRSTSYIPRGLCHRLLALMSVFDYTPALSYEKKRELGFNILESVSRLQDTDCGEHNPLLTILKSVHRQQQKSRHFLLIMPALIWKLWYTHSCPCLKQVIIHGHTQCSQCLEAYQVGATVFNTISHQVDVPPLLAALHLSLFNVLEQNVPTYRRFRDLVPAVQFVLRARLCRSWVEDYAFATHTYYQVLQAQMANNNLFAKDGPMCLSHWARHHFGREISRAMVENWGKEMFQSIYPSETFLRLCGPSSEEYRRSLWHLSSFWAQKGEWEQVETKLRPLVEDSIRQTSVSWSHERCIIRTVQGLREQGRSQEAIDMLTRVKDAYTKQNKSLTSVEAELSHHHSLEIEKARSKFLRFGPTTNKAIQIFVKSITEKTITVTVRSTDLVQSLYVAFHEREGLPSPSVRMIYGGKQLEPQRPLSEYGLQNGSTVHVVLRLLGGNLVSWPTVGTQWRRSRGGKSFVG